MCFKDTLCDCMLTLNDIHNDWFELYCEDPENVPASFLTYMYDVIEATVNGRNDLEFINMPPKTVRGIMRRLVRVANVLVLG